MIPSPMMAAGRTGFTVPLLLRSETTLVDLVGVSSISVHGSVAQTTVEERFGSWSTLISGNSTQRLSYVQAAHISSLFVFPQDFTMEGWFNLISFTDAYHSFFGSLITFPNPGWWTFQVLSTGALAFGASSVSHFTSSSGLFTLGSWHHVAITRSGGTIRLFLDGVMVASQSSTGTIGSVVASISYFLIGAGTSDASDNGDINGYFEEIRVTKGIARYAANFTPPAAPFPYPG